jgi:hypothetical protein
MPLIGKKMINIIKGKKTIQVLVLLSSILFFKNSIYAAEYRAPEIPIMADIVDKAISNKCGNDCWNKGFMSVTADNSDVYVVIYQTEELWVAQKVINDIFEAIQKNKIKRTIRLFIYKSKKSSHGIFGSGEKLLIEMVIKP